MATSNTMMSVEDYLKYTGKPNCEYIDGELRPKPMATSLHGLLELLLAMILRRQGVDARPEVTIRVSPTQFLIPDVIADDVLADPYPNKPVLLCVEILSPEDRLSSMVSKCEAYHEWGVKYCWIVDPLKQVAYEYHAGAVLTNIQANGILKAGELLVQLSDLFSPDPKL
jgi:Uma2 family endonuclease